MYLSSLELGLRLLQWPELSDEGHRRERGARGSWFRAHRPRKAAEWWRIGGEGSSGESFGAGRSGLRNGARRSEGERWEEGMLRMGSGGGMP
jgi:hypothetical protein